MHDSSLNTAEGRAEELQKGLRKLARVGSATAADFIFEAPETLHALRELGLEDAPDSPLEEQLSLALGRAISALPGPDSEAARVLLGLDAEHRGSQLGERRELAAKALGISTGTFRNRHEARVLNRLAREIALDLVPAESGQRRPRADANQVLVLHGKDSFGAREVGRLIESLGLSPLPWNEAVDRAGISSPAVTERFRSCLDFVQAVVVVLEGGLAESRTNLAFEAGLALGLAGDRTVIVQLGDEEPPADLATSNILRLRNTRESVAALSSALRRAGCSVPDPLPDAGGITESLPDVGWYQWAPDRASNPMYGELTRAIAEFEPLDFAAGREAAKWLQTQALDEHPAIVTWVKVGNGRVEGFVALRATSIKLTSDSKPDEILGATELLWMARHKDASPGVQELLSFATSVAHDAAEKQGSAALVVEAHDEKTARVLNDKYSLAPVAGTHKLLLPLTAPDGHEEEGEGAATPPLTTGP